MLKYAQNQAGYTLVELLLAMAIFAFGLLIIIGGYLSLVDYYQGSIQARAVQTAARTGLNQVELAGNSASWFAYDNNNAGDGIYAVCLSSGIIFYLNNAVFPNQLMRATWDTSQACTSTGTTNPTAVIGSDVKVSAFIPEQADNYNVHAATPCVSAGCGPGTLYNHKSLRLTIRTTSDLVDLIPGGTACAPSAPATCEVATLSTTVTAGEF